MGKKCVFSSFVPARMFWSCQQLLLFQQDRQLLWANLRSSYTRSKGGGTSPPTVFYLIAEKSWSLYFYRLCLCFEMSNNRRTYFLVQYHVSSIDCSGSLGKDYENIFFPCLESMTSTINYVIWKSTTYSVFKLLPCIVLFSLFLFLRKKWKFFPPYLLYTSHDNELLLFPIQLSLFQALFSFPHNPLLYFSSPFSKSFQVLL